MSSSPSNLLQIVLALGLVLGLMLLAAWLMRRMGSITRGSQLPMKVVGGLHLSHRERLVVVEFGEQWILLGVTGTQINLLNTMPRQENIAFDPNPSWLKRTLDARNDLNKDSNQAAPASMHTPP